jgi:hypothetical protein
MPALACDGVDIEFVVEGSASSFTSPDDGTLMTVTEEECTGAAEAAFERAEMSFDPDGRLVFRDFLWSRVVTRVDAIISMID